MADIPVIPSLGNLGSQPCYLSEQDRYIDYMTKTTWSIQMGITAGVYVGDTSPADATLVWLKIDPGTGRMVIPAPLLFDTSLGLWVARYRVPPQPDHKEIMMWKGTEAELWAYDGGTTPIQDPGATGTNPTVATGSFWYWDRDYDDRVPGGYDDSPGTLLAQDTDYDILTTAAPPAGGSVQVRSAIFARRTTREFWTG